MTVSTSESSKKHEGLDGPVLVVGIGSSHGDDRAGWEVIDGLADVVSKVVVLRKASVPHDLLDWIDSHSTTHIVDASRDQVPGLRRYAITQEQNGGLRLKGVNWSLQEETEFTFGSLRSSSTHELDLLSTLDLAATLGRLPHPLYLWTVSIESVEQNANLADRTKERVREAVEAIRTSL